LGKWCRIVAHKSELETALRLSKLLAEDLRSFVEKNLFDVDVKEFAQKFGFESTRFDERHPSRLDRNPSPGWHQGDQIGRIFPNAYRAFVNFFGNEKSGPFLGATC
jgi:hypothetical protein